MLNDAHNAPGADVLASLQTDPMNRNGLITSATRIPKADVASDLLLARVEISIDNSRLRARAIVRQDPLGQLPLPRPEGPLDPHGFRVIDTLPALV